MTKKEFLSKYTLLEEDIIINTYSKCKFDNHYSKGVEVELVSLDVKVASHLEKSQIKNLNICFDMLDLILTKWIDDKKGE